jgi:beta-glucosidase
MRNLSKRTGKGVAQVYAAPVEWSRIGWEAPKRLVGFSKIELKPGQRKRVELSVDPRLLAVYEAAGNNWHIKAATYQLMLGESSNWPVQRIEVTLPDSRWSASKGAQQ